MLTYGPLEFRLRDNRLRAIALALEGLEHQSTGVTLEPSCSLHRDSIESVLARHDIGWKVDEIMSEGADQVLITTNGLHLAFRGKKLTRIVADFSRS